MNKVHLKEQIVPAYIVPARTITSCQQCPHYNEDEFSCGHLLAPDLDAPYGSIPDGSIPDWCPLLKKENK